MTYVEQQKNLTRATNGLPPQSLKVAGFVQSDLVFFTEEVGDSFGLTLGEIGEICELVRQVITKEREPKDFEAGLLEKLDEDNREKAGEIVMALSEKLFAKLLPALGIKVPLEMAIKGGAVPKVEGLEATDLAPRQVPLKRMPFTLPNANPPLATPASTPNPPNSSLQAPAPTPIQPKPKPPIMETGHERMSDTPIDSLMKMLEGRVTEKELSLHFEKLPGSLKNALGSIDSAKKVVDIGRKYGLHVDKLGELGAETGMVILGFTHPGQFLQRITRRLDLPEEQVRPIAQEINTEIFLKIREALKEVHGESSTPKPSGTIPVKPTPPKAPEPSKPKTETGLVYDKDITILPETRPTDETAESFEEKDKTLDRGMILSGIENPTLMPVNSTLLNKKEVREASWPVAPIPTSLQNPASRSTPLTESTSKPPVSETVIIAKSPTANIIPQDFKPVPPKPIQNPPEIPRPSALPQNPPESSAPRAKSIIEQKLQGATISAKSESKYSADPYREPLQ